MQNVKIKHHELPYEVNEEIKYLRANIQFSGAEKKVIMITSSFSGEGKSTISLLLAQSLTELGKRVLLIDADLRRSTLSKELEVGDMQFGLSHYLSGQSELAETLAVSEEPVLYLLVAGPVPPNPAELLANQKAEALLAWARKQFDYVLVDTAPLGTVSDAMALAGKCDGAAIVIEAGKTPYRAVQNVVKQIRDVNCPILGTILNKVDTGSGRKYYNRYYYKKGNYEYKKNDRKK